MRRQRRGVGTEVIVYYSVSRWGPAGLPCDGENTPLPGCFRKKAWGQRGGMGSGKRNTRLKIVFLKLLSGLSEPQQQTFLYSCHQPYNKNEGKASSQWSSKVVSLALRADYFKGTCLLTRSPKIS